MSEPVYYSQWRGHPQLEPSPEVARIMDKWYAEQRQREEAEVAASNAAREAAQWAHSHERQEIAALRKRVTALEALTPSDLATVADLGEYVAKQVAALTKPEITYDGRRTFTIRVGDTAESFVAPVVLDAGVWKAGTLYAQGDGVTFGGSFWIAQKDMPEGKPDAGNGSWRLSVKAGRNAR
jgi:hypothetical protein